MKKYILTVLIVTAAFMMIKCSSQKSATFHSVTVKDLFDYPDDLVADTAKKRFVKEFNKSKACIKLPVPSTIIYRHTGKILSLIFLYPN